MSTGARNVSFLFESETLEPGKSGKISVVRGNADAGEMIISGLPPTEKEVSDFMNDRLNVGRFACAIRAGDHDECGLRIIHILL